MRFTGLLNVFDRWGATAGLVVAAVAYCLFIDVPYGAQTAKLRNETAERREFIAQAKQLAEEAVTIEAKGRSASDYVKAWHDATPNSADAGSFFGEVHQAVRKSGVAVTRFEPQTLVTLASVEQRPIALTLEGSHAEVAAALVNIEKLPATIWVKDVVLTPVRERAGLVRFDSKLVVFTDKAANSD